jgi:hypothetical protein
VVEACAREHRHDAAVLGIERLAFGGRPAGHGSGPALLAPALNFLDELGARN